jgi:Histidine kinase-like ATPase domain
MPQPRRDTGSIIKLTCDSEPLVLDLDLVTALGIVVAEVVTNSYEHAFPGGKGSIILSVQNDFRDADTATMTISDDGEGFQAEAESKRHGLGLVRRLVEQPRSAASRAALISHFPRLKRACDLPGSSNRKRSPAAVRPPGSLGGNAQRGPRTATDKQCLPDAHPLTARGPSGVSPN